MFRSLLSSLVSVGVFLSTGILTTVCVALPDDPPAPVVATPAAPAETPQASTESNKAVEPEKKSAEQPAEPEKPPLPDELGVFNAATVAYNDGLFDRAEKEFAQFRTNYPNSTNLVNAVVYQGLSLYRQGKFAETLNYFRPFIAETNAVVLNTGKDRYRYWSGMAASRLDNYPGAITFFNDLLKEYPNSKLVPNALYYLGVSWRKLGNNKKTLELFESSPFTEIAEKESNNIYIIQSRLLQAETLLTQNEFDKAQAILKKIADNNLPPELQWKRLYLLSRVNLARQDITGAGLNITNLLTLTTNSGLLNLEYQALALQGDLLKQENRMDEASAVYEKNVANKLIPIEDRWMALMNTVKIKLELNKQEDAIRLLQYFKNETGTPPYNDELLMTLGNLQLQQYYKDTPEIQLMTPGQGLKNETLLNAYTNYTTLLTTFTNSTFLPKVFMDLGLCYWELDKQSQAMQSLSNAVQAIPISEDNAFARIKLAEIQFYKKDFKAAAGTIAEYIKNYASAPGIPAYLQEQALHIQLCSAAENRDEELAKSAMATALTKYPKSIFTERDLIYLGNYLCDIGKPAEGRAQFQECMRLFPKSPTLSQISYSLARTWLYEKKYPEAIKAYQTWIESTSPDSPLYALAQFELAWSYAQNGENEIALGKFTVFLNEHPGAAFTTLARKWIADYYFNQTDFFTAEKNYQLIYERTNSIGSIEPMILDARLMAARSAFSRGAFRDATDHLRSLVTLLLSKQSPPTDVLDTALLLLGDALIEDVGLSKDPQAKSTRFAEAINAYSRIAETNRLGAVALGRIANCHFQLAGGDPPDTNRVALAISFYKKSMTASQGTVETHSLAELGLAALYQQQAHLASIPQKQKDAYLEKALEHYCNIYECKTGNPNEYDPFCVQKAGMEAARICEEKHQWREACGIYERLSLLIPSLQPLLKRKIEFATKQFPRGDSTSQ